MPAAQVWRWGLFALVCAALLAAALAFAGSRPAAPSAPSTAGLRVQAAGAAPAPPALGAVARLRAALGAVAQRFLRAFFRYEVGAAGPRVRAALRATATRGFAAELLAAPPRRPPSRPAPALPGRLTIAFASALPPRALVSGSARRGGEAEQFSFLFAAVDGRWRASGPGE